MQCNILHALTVAASIHLTASAVQPSTSAATRVKNEITSPNVADQAKHAPTTNQDKVHLSQAEHPTPHIEEDRHIE